MSGPDRIWAHRSDAKDDDRWFFDCRKERLSPYEVAFTRTDLIPAMIEAAVKAERERGRAELRQVDWLSGAVLLMAIGWVGGVVSAVMVAEWAVL